MKALKIEPGKAPERIDIGNELEALQDAVGGYIQVLYPDQHRPVGLICNEEGQVHGPQAKPDPVQGRPSLTTSLLAHSSWLESMKRTSRICGEEDATYFEKLFHSPEKFKYFAGRLVISKVVSGGA